MEAEGDWWRVMGWFQMAPNGTKNKNFERHYFVDGICGQYVMNYFKWHQDGDGAISQNPKFEVRNPTCPP
jgi:hypothetical protein